MLAGTTYELICFVGRKGKKRFVFTMRTLNRLPDSFTWKSDMFPAMLTLTLGFSTHKFPFV